MTMEGSAFLKGCILMFAIAAIPVIGKLELFSAAFITNFIGLIRQDQESYIYLQIALEQISDDVGLYDLPEKERIIEGKKLMKNSTVQKLIEECSTYNIEPNCNIFIYRTYNGVCNNIKHPLWGSSGYMINRLLPAAYKGISGLRKSVTGGDLPSPRNISLKLVDQKNPTEHVSAMFTFFGQLIAHDVTSSPVVARNGQSVPCCVPPEMRDASCINIYFSDDDPFYKRYNFTCFRFTRSAPYPKCNFEKRSPINRETSFLDASLLYGYNEIKANDLRRNDGSGKLRSQYSIHGELLPANSVQNSTFCPTLQTTNCFAAGDDRVNQHATLSSLQTVLMRFHNKIADALYAVNPKWGEEMTYQETRRLVIAVFQNIIYSEYLPWLVGPKLMKNYKLTVDEESFYNNEVNPSTLAEFTTGSFRLHSMVPEMFSKYNPYTRFHETYSNPQLLHDGMAESLVAGSCEVPSEKNDRYQTADISGKLYRPPLAAYGTDLTSADMQRGRDHGIPSYVDVLKKCSNGTIDIRDFSDLSQVMSEANVNLLQSTYGNVLDIDLLIGIYLETQINQSVTGYTAACLSAEQFYRLKFGDNFFFSHKNGRYPFTNEQLKSIRNFSLAQLICQAGGFYSIRKYPLLLPSETNYMMNCYSVPLLDLEPWKE